MKRTLALFLPVLLIMTSCFKDIPGPGGGFFFPAGYPHHVGDSWTYELNGGTYNFRPIDSTVHYTPDTLFAVATVTITGEQALPTTFLPGDSVSALVFEATEQQMRPVAQTFVSVNYFTLTDTAFLLHGYSGSGGTLITPTAARTIGRVSIAGRSFGCFREMIDALTSNGPSSTTDTIMREVPPLKAIEYPLIAGSQWTFRPSGRPWRIDKQAVGSTSLVVGGTTYQCSIVRWLEDLGNEGTWDADISIVDYIAIEGLLKRSIEVRNVSVSTVTNPDGIGLVDFKREYLATTVNLR